METHSKIKEIFLAVFLSVLVIFLLALLPYIIDIIKNIINSIKHKSKNLKKDIKPKTQQEIRILTQQEKKEITRENLKIIVIELQELAKKNPYFIGDFKLSLVIFKKKLTKDFFLDNDYTLLNTYKYALFLFPYLFDDNKVSKKSGIYLFSDQWIIGIGCKHNDVFSLIYRIRMLLDNDLECNEFDFETNKIIK